MAGTLYVVATPIGNLEDLTFRAIRILREVAVIAAEDTRVTRKLLARYDIHTPLTSYHAHSDPGRLTAILSRLEQGEDVALVSDAGTPGVSDPGGALVRAAIEAGLLVTSVPGPSAVIAALSVSGLDPSRFLFQGFLPRSPGERRKALRPLRELPHTLIFYEAPARVAGLLGALREELGNRQAVVAREITKKFEEFLRGPLPALEERFRSDPPRGECVVLVAGAEDREKKSIAETPGTEVEECLRALLTQGASVRDASRLVAGDLGLPKREVYDLAQRLADEGE